MPVPSRWIISPLAHFTSHEEKLYEATVLHLAGLPYGAVASRANREAPLQPEETLIDKHLFRRITQVVVKG